MPRITSPTISSHEFAARPLSALMLGGPSVDITIPKGSVEAGKLIQASVVLLIDDSWRTNRLVREVCFFLLPRNHEVARATRVPMNAFALRETLTCVPVPM